MKFSGQYRIDAPRAAVWTALNDPDVLGRCIPGCEDVVKETDVNWTVRVAIRLGPINARFTGRLALEDLRPPESCTIVGEGSGGAAGHSKGRAFVRLTEEGAGTLLDYDSEVEMGGKIAQLGARLINGYASKYADEFFGRFAEIVSAGGAGEPGVQGTAQPAPAAAPARDGPPPVAALGPVPAAAAPPLAPLPPPAPLDPRTAHPGRRMDPQSFVIVVLAALLVFMTVMFALKP